MIPDDQLDSLERQVKTILEGSGWTAVPAPDVGRIEVIAFRASLEASVRPCTPPAFREYDAALRRDRIVPPADQATCSEPRSNNTRSARDRDSRDRSEERPIPPLPRPAGDRGDPDPRLDPTHP